MFSAYQIQPYYIPLQEIVIRNINYLISGQGALKELYTTLINGVGEPDDPRAWKFDKHIQKEVEGLLRRETWKIVVLGEVPENSDILNGKFVLAIINEGKDTDIWKKDLLFKDTEMK